MKREDLLEAIGNVDESLLAESEELTMGRKTPALWRLAVAAAVLALTTVTAFAAARLLSRPVEGGAIVTEGTVSPVSFVRGDIYPEPQVGLKVVMEVEVDEDAPRTLEEIFHLKLEGAWTEHFRSSGGNGFEYNEHTAVWKMAEKTGEVRLKQTAVSGYVNGVNGKNVVDCLLELPLDTAVTAEVVTLAQRQLLKVTIPAVELEGYADQSVAYYRDGETRLYWSDGRYLFRLDYPVWVSEAEAEEMLQSLYSQPFTPDYPEGWGEIDMQRLQEMGFAEETGTTSFNISNAGGSALYADGRFYFGEAGAIRVYDAQSGQQTVLQTWESSVPRGMLLTESGISFADSKLPRWGRYHMSTDGETVETLYEGFQLADLWYADGALYGIDEARNLLCIGLETGQRQTLAENVNKFYMDGNRLYVLPEKENCFLRADTDALEFERIELSFCPISMAADGEVLYLTAGGQVSDSQRRYQVVRYSGGEETKLPVYGTRLQVVGGKLLYDADPDNSLIEMYDPESGEIDLLQKNVFDFFVFEDRFVVFSYYNDGWGILDRSTGELTNIEAFHG